MAGPWWSWTRQLATTRARRSKTYGSAARSCGAPWGFRDDGGRGWGGATAAGVCRLWEDRGQLRVERGAVSGALHSGGGVRRGGGAGGGVLPAVWREAD